MSSVKDLVAQLDAAKLEERRRAREEAQAAAARSQAEAAQAEARAAAEAAAEREAAAAAAKAEREKWRVDEDECAREVAELKRKLVTQIEKPKPKKVVEVKSIPTIVIDIGSGAIKAGFAGEDAPRCVFTSVIGAIKNPETMDLEKHSHVKKDVYVGDECWAFADVLKISRVIKKGTVHNKALLPYLFRHIFFEELGISKDDIKDHPIFLTEPPLSAKANRELLAQLLFNEFKIPALFVANTSSLAIFGSGRVIGLVIDIGYAVATSAALFDGEVLPRSLRRLDLGGADLDAYLAKLLQKRGYDIDERRLFDSFIIRDIKEQCCYVAEDFEAEKAKSEAELKMVYDVTDHGNPHLPGYEDRRMGDSIELSHERYLCAEALFDPEVCLGRQDAILNGIHNMVAETIRSLPIDLKRDMYANIVLSGGTTLLPGLAERIKAEVKRLVPPTVDVTVHAPVNRHLSVWAGGSVLASTQHFNGHWISRDEFEAYGSELLHATR